MIHHVAEQEPGLGIARMEGDGVRVGAFRLGAATPEPGVLCFQQEAVPLGEALPVAPGPVGGLARWHDERARRQHRGQPVVRQRERIVEGGGVPKASIASKYLPSRNARSPTSQA